MTIQESEELPRSTMAPGSSESLGLSAFVRSMVRSITGLGIILASKLDTVSLKDYRWANFCTLIDGQTSTSTCNNYNHVELQNRFDRFSPTKFFLVSIFPHFLFPVS